MAGGDIYLYPAGAGGVAVTQSATAWTNGTAVTLVPAATIASPVDITGLQIEMEMDLSTAGTRVDATYEAEFDILVGGVVVMTLPFAIRYDTAVGARIVGQPMVAYLPSIAGYRLAAGTACTIQARGSSAVADAYRVKAYMRTALDDLADLVVQDWSTANYSTVFYNSPHTDVSGSKAKIFSYNAYDGGIQFQNGYLREFPGNRVVSKITKTPGSGTPDFDGEAWWAIRSDALDTHVVAWGFAETGGTYGQWYPYYRDDGNGSSGIQYPVLNVAQMSSDRVVYLSLRIDDETNEVVWEYCFDAPFTAWTEVHRREMPQGFDGARVDMQYGAGHFGAGTDATLYFEIDWLNGVDSSGTNYTQTPADVANITDGLVTARAIVLGLADSANIADANALALAWARSQGDSANIADVATPVEAYATTIGDSANISDVPTTESGKSAQINDSANISDSQALVNAFLRTQADNANVGDAVSTAAAYLILRGDSATITDAVQTVQAALLAVSDGAQVSDITLPSWGATAAPADAATITDQVASLNAFQRTQGDSATITDALAFAIAKAQDDAATIADLAVSLSTVFITQGDAANITDSAATSGSGALTASINDNANIGDNAALVQALQRIQADAANITDSQNMARSLGLSDLANISDLIALPYRVNLNDPANISDAVTPVQTLTSVIADAATIADATTQTLVTAKSVADDATITDFIDPTLATFRDLLDALIASDTILAGLDTLGLYPDITLLVMDLAVTTLRLADSTVTRLLADERAVLRLEVSDEPVLGAETENDAMINLDLGDRT